MVRKGGLVIRVLTWQRAVSASAFPPLWQHNSNQIPFMSTDFSACTSLSISHFCVLVFHKEKTGVFLPFPMCGDTVLGGINAGLIHLHICYLWVTSSCSQFSPVLRACLSNDGCK